MRKLFLEETRSRRVVKLAWKISDSISLDLRSVGTDLSWNGEGRVSYRHTAGSGCDADRGSCKKKTLGFRWWIEHNGAFITTYGASSVKIETYWPLNILAFDSPAVSRSRRDFLFKANFFLHSKEKRAVLFVHFIHIFIGSRKYSYYYCGWSSVEQCDWIDKFENWKSEKNWNYRTRWVTKLFKHLYKIFRNILRAFRRVFWRFEIHWHRMWILWLYCIY